MKQRVFNHLCDAAMARKRFHPAACQTCESRCEYGRQALDLMGIQMGRESGRDDLFEMPVYGRDRKANRIISAINKRRVK